jgi:predicted Zn-dependent protease
MKAADLPHEVIMEAIRLYEEGVLHEANSENQKTIELSPDDVDNWLALASSQFISGKNTETIRSLQRAVELDPKCSLAWISLSMAYLREGNDAGCKTATGHAARSDLRHVKDFLKHIEEK